MNLPGIDTCVCDASVAKDADAHVSQICPRLEGRRMSPIGRFCCRRPPLPDAVLRGEPRQSSRCAEVGAALKRSTRLQRYPRPHATAGSANGGGRPASLASLRRFCAIAARVNSN